MAGFREFAAGEPLTAANINGFLMKQSVMVFATAAARTAALGSAVSEGMLTYNLATNALEVFDGIGFVTASAPDNAFNDVAVVTATDAAFPVPSLSNPIVKVTLAGAGGSGGGRNTSGAAGGSTTFNAGEGKTFTVSGGSGGARSGSAETSGLTGRAGFSAGNNGTGRIETGNTGGPGTGGDISVHYVDLGGIETVAITIGAGGGSSDFRGGGGRGEVRIEFKAA